MRKITNLEVFSNQRIEMLKDIHLSELSTGINELYGRWTEHSHRPVVVELNKWFQKAIFEFFRLSGVFVVSDAIPFLWWLDLHGHEKQMKKTRDFDAVVGRWLNEHRQKRELKLKGNKDDVKDFIDVMLSLEDEGQLSNMEHDSETIIKSTSIAEMGLNLRTKNNENTDEVELVRSVLKGEREREHVPFRSLLELTTATVDIYRLSSIAKSKGKDEDWDVIITGSCGLRVSG
ncbi:hypothetical protein L1987_53336 [Smallanthus sonchifolius]|uniref:Uncharacterized protein n=1 Tax=Smallanthus sonchifolius TaxID=185202 RepID=A0ACB9EV37_9ASTR|nr:hypothetical protein L1987_53336 [Smallanthus sonchifolius]